MHVIASLNTELIVDIYPLGMEIFTVITSSPIALHTPPRVENAVYVRGNDTVHYSCRKGFTLVGYKNISCMLSGHWPRAPQCVSATPIEETKSLLAPLISVFVIVILVILIIIITVICIIKLKAKRTHSVNRVEMQADIELILKRNRVFDAFVLYHFDSDDDFVISHLLPDLEEARDFKLCIHSRNFTPGRDIKDNIEEAIEGSNSAIIVMSQGFVDSPWCKEEFTHCYIENMKDAAFNLFVIMMQPSIHFGQYVKLHENFLCQ